MVHILNKVPKWKLFRNENKSTKAKRWSPNVTFKMKSVYSTDLFLRFPPRLPVIRVFHAAEPFPTQWLSPSFTVAFSVKQDEACSHSNCAKGSFIEINNGRDFALLVNPPEWFLFCAHQRSQPRAFPDRPERGREQGSTPTLTISGETGQILMNPYLSLCFVCSTY